MKQKIGILIDSSCTFEPSYLKEHKIELVPLSCTDGANVVHDDNECAPEQWLARLDIKEPFKTSATQLGKLMNKVEDMLEKYENVIFLPISKGLSSQYQQSFIIKNDHPNNFFVIDSKTSGTGNEFILYDLVELVQKNLNPQEIVNLLANKNKYIISFFSCEDLSGMINGGRIRKIALQAINAVKLKPIICLDNENHVTGFGKNYKSILEKMIKKINKCFKKTLNNNDIKHISVYFSGYPKEKLNYCLDTVAKSFQMPKEKILVRWIPNVVLMHTLRGAFGITIETNISRE